MRRLRPLLWGLLAALWLLPAQAKEGDTFRPFVSLGHFYDSNLFRLADDEYPGIQRDDRYNVLNVGINVDWKPGRQQIVASATRTLIRYDQNTYLDFDGDDLSATWNWRLGNHFSGNLGVTQSTTQSSFSDIGLVNNQVDRNRRFGRAEWAFHPRWSIGGGVESMDNSNSAPSQASQDFDRQAQDLVLSYRTPKGSSLRGQLRRIDADFPNLQCVENGFPFCFTVADNSYKQTESNLLGDWRFSGKLTVRGQVGWVDRKYENALREYDNLFVPDLKPRPDYSGLTGRVAADWYATGKTLLSVAAYRELGGATDINASSVLKHGATVNGVWLVREKWRLNAAATFENRDFQGDPGTSQPQRNDDTVNATLALSYTPIRPVSLDLGVSAGRRDSNISVEDYKFHSVFVNLRADF